MPHRSPLGKKVLSCCLNIPCFRSYSEPRSPHDKCNANTQPDLSNDVQYGNYREVRAPGIAGWARHHLSIHFLGHLLMRKCVVGLDRDKTLTGLRAWHTTPSRMAVDATSSLAVSFSCFSSHSEFPRKRYAVV